MSACYLPISVTLNRGSAIFPLVVHFFVHLVSSTVALAWSVHKFRGDNVGAVRDDVDS